MLENHRREVVALFPDLRGFTAFSETPARGHHGGAGGYHGAVGPLIRKHEGTLDRFTGDGMLVFFNDLPARMGRSVRPGWRSACASVSDHPTWKRRGHQLGFGLGMAQGYATLRRIG